MSKPVSSKSSSGEVLERLKALSPTVIEKPRGEPKSGEAPKGREETVDRIKALEDARATMSIKGRADEDRAVMMAVMNEQVKLSAPVNPEGLLNGFRDTADNFLKGAVSLGGTGNFDDEAHALTNAMRELEKARDARTGIELREIHPEEGVPILVRDARNCKKPPDGPIRGPESDEIQYLSMIRGAMNIAEIDGKPELRAELLGRASTFLAEFRKEKGDLPINLDERLAQEKKWAKELEGGVSAIAVWLGERGIDNARTKIDIAKEYQNLKEQHFNIATLSTVYDSNGKPRVAMEAEVGMKGVTDEIKAEYQKVKGGKGEELPWFKALAPYEKALVRENVDAFIAGEHVLSTWLLHGPGMKNAFEKITAVTAADDHDNENGLKVLDKSKHSGTLASVARDPDAREEITKKNIEQAKEWNGKGVDTHIVSLNSAVIGRSHDKVVTEQLGAVAPTVDGVKWTNAAFNLGRSQGRTSKLDGVNAVIKPVSDALTKLAENKSSQVVEALRLLNVCLEPRNDGDKGRWFGGLRRFMSHPIDSIRSRNPEKLIEGLDAAQVFTADDVKLLKEVVQLRRDADEVGMPTRFFGKGNASKELTTRLHEITTMVKDAEPGASNVSNAVGKLQIEAAAKEGDAQEKGAAAKEEKSASKTIAEKLGIEEKEAKEIIKKALKDPEIIMKSLASKLGLDKEETITMCTSGKDRTADAMNRRTTGALSKELRVDIGEVSKEITAGGHSAQQAGGVYSCGGTPGCNGVRVDATWGVGNVAQAAVRGAVIHKISSEGAGRGTLEIAEAQMAEYSSHATGDKRYDLVGKDGEQDLAHGKIHEVHADYQYLQDKSDTPYAIGVAKRLEQKMEKKESDGKSQEEEVTKEVNVSAVEARGTTAVETATVLKALVERHSAVLNEVALDLRALAEPLQDRASSPDGVAPAGIILPPNPPPAPAEKLPEKLPYKRADSPGAGDSPSGQDAPSGESAHDEAMKVAMSSDVIKKMLASGLEKDVTDVITPGTARGAERDLEKSPSGGRSSL